MIESVQIEPEMPKGMLRGKKNLARLWHCSNIAHTCELHHAKYGTRAHRGIWRQAMCDLELATKVNW